MRLPGLRGGLRFVLGLAALSAFAAGCGDDDERVSPSPEADHATQVERNPYAVTCGDLASQTVNPARARLVIHAEFALAQVPALRRVVAKQTLNRAGRSVYFAMTEICKGRDASFKPGRLAVEGVLEGKYRAAENRPG